MKAAVANALPTLDFDSFHAAYVKTAGRIAFREHGGSTIYEVADVEQAIWERVIVDWKSYSKADAKFVEIYMTRTARDFASAERLAHMYASGAFIYTPKQVMSFLESHAWGVTAGALGVDVRADLAEAFERLRKSAPTQAKAVHKRYAPTPDSLSSNERSNCSRGVKSLMDRLNSGLRLHAEPVDVVVGEER
ncbi:hypothetical protein CQ020_03645 [Arthrobacter sp. MYb23]|uniref:hypothetical protein n=1 Tax=unclassified Arthrobacter TaxID=235627 RepID=UPI000CFD9B34|nr:MULTISPECIES: hypothetical protein [unclassified Arthrobacter]PRB44314.1 hypothetical protein CQ038_03500 [Arthrobacter sp. MYb51]PRB98566.1 hypothetical protein CQ020_03645 [Arthrobacter sp. MYb23]